MSFQSSVPGFEVERPMVVEIMSFADHPGLTARLLVRLSLVANGPGHVYAKDYDIHVVREDRTTASFPVEGMNTLIEEALLEGKSPLATMFEHNQHLLDQVGAIDRRIESSITSKRIMSASGPAAPGLTHGRPGV